MEELTVSNSQANVPVSPGKVLRLIVPLIVLVVLAGAGLLGYQLWQQNCAEREAALSHLNRQKHTLRSRICGALRFSQVDIVADGGLVDLRYQVFDADKAVFLFDLENTPKIIAANGDEIGLTSPPHVHDLESGQTYFMLFRNIKGVIRPGSEITVVVGGINLEHYKVLE